MEIVPERPTFRHTESPHINIVLEFDDSALQHIDFRFARVYTQAAWIEPI
jgi:hypothetical protein